MGTHWTAEELHYLFKLYPEHGPRWEYWGEYLPGRSYEQIKTKASRVGVKWDRPTKPGAKPRREKKPKAPMDPGEPMPFTIAESKAIIRSLLNLKRRLKRDPMDILDHAHDLCTRHLQDQERNDS